MFKEKILKRQKKQLEKQQDRLSSMEDRFFDYDSRFEIIFLINGVVGFAFLVSTYLCAISEMDSKILTILLGTACLQTVVGCIFALGLTRKIKLSKKKYFSGLIVHGIMLSGFIFLFLLDIEGILWRF